MRRLLALLTALVALVPGAGRAQTDIPLRAGITQEPGTLDPMFATTLVESDAMNLLFDGLARTDAAGALVPDLAREIPTLANGGIARDGKAVTYHLVRNARFGDGTPVTSADVKFTYDTQLDPRNGTPFGYVAEYVARIDAPDPWTVIFRLRKPYAPLIGLMSDGIQGGIVPAHVLRGAPDLRRAPFSAAPIGSGPYRLVRWVRGDRMEFEANPGYFRGAPAIRRIVWRFIENDNTLATMLRTHEVDMANNMTVAPFVALGDVPGLRKQVGPGSLWEHLTFNLRTPALSDVRVRRALCSATDFKGLLAKIAHGLGTLAVAEVNPASPYYDRTLAPCPYDLALARMLLDQAGWHQGPGGVRVKDGQRLALTGSTLAGFVDREQTLLQLQNAWREIGVDLAIKTYPATLFFAPKQAGGIVNNGKFDVALYAFGFSDPDPTRTSVITPSGIPPNGTNAGFYTNPEVAKLEDAGVATFDPTRRKAIYDRVQRIVAADVPFITLRWRPRLIVSDEHVAGVHPNVVGSDWWNVAEWRFPG